MLDSLLVLDAAFTSASAREERGSWAMAMAVSPSAARMRVMALSISRAVNLCCPAARKRGICSPEGRRLR